MRCHKAIILFLACVVLYSCQKESSACYDIKFEISGNSATADSIDFRLAGSGSSYASPDVSKFYTNLIVPYSETVNICKEDFDYNLRCYDGDTSLVLTLKIFRDGILIDQKTGSPNNFVELAGGIND